MLAFPVAMLPAHSLAEHSIPSKVEWFQARCLRKILGIPYCTLILAACQTPPKPPGTVGPSKAGSGSHKRAYEMHFSDLAPASRTLLLS